MWTLGLRPSGTESNIETENAEENTSVHLEAARLGPFFFFQYWKACIFQCRERKSIRHPSFAVNTCRLLVCFAHAVRDLFVQVLWVIQGGIERRFCERVLLQAVSFSGSSPGCAPHKTTTCRV